MRNRELLLAVVLATAGLMLFGVGQSTAGNIYYTDGFRDNVNPSYPVADETDFWWDPNNWNTAMDGSGTYRLPQSGDFIHFGTNGIEYVRTDIDLDGNSVYLPDVSCNLNRYEYRFIDTRGGATLTLNEFKANMYGPHSVAVPLIAHRVKTDYRVGTMTFFSTVDANELDFGNGNIKLHSDVTVADSALFRKNGGVHVYLQPDPADANDPIPTLTAPLLNVQDVGTVADMNGYVVSPQINVYKGGKYNVNIDGAAGDASTTIDLDSGGNLSINVEQTTSFPGQINVNAYGLLSGNMTGADYSASGNVTFAEDAIYAPSVEPTAPTRADLGDDAIIWQGGVNAGGTYVVGDNEVDAIYKGVAFGAFTNSYRMNSVSVTAAPGSGNLKALWIGDDPQIGSATRWYGDGNSRTADISALYGGQVDMQMAFNNGADYSTDPNLIRTFNISGDASAITAQIMEFRENHVKILPEQTMNVSLGKMKGTTSLTGAMPGNLTLTDCIFEQPSDDFAATDGNVTINGVTVMEVTNTGNYDFLENLGDRFVINGMPIVALKSETYHTFDYDPNGATPVLAKLLVNADLANNSYKWMGIDGDLQIGHEKYYQNSIYRSNNWSGTPYGINSTNGSRIVAAGNAPTGETDVLGFAALDGQLIIGVEVYAPGAIVRCGTMDPNRITKFYDAMEKSPAENRVEFRETVTADTLELRSGTVLMRIDQSFPTLDLGEGTTLQMDSGKTVTVSETLIGTGKWTGGNGVAVIGTVSPGAGIATLNDGGGDLTFDDGATYEWQIANLAPESEGTGWDLIKGANITFNGELVLSIDDSLLTGSVDGTESFTVASATGTMGELASYSFLGNWVGTLTVVDGTDLVLTGLTLDTVPGDANGDGVLDAADYIMVKKHFGGAPGAEGPGGDFDGNGIVDWNDLQSLQTAFNAGSGAGTPIPEPATLGLLAIGAMSLIRRRRS